MSFSDPYGFGDLLRVFAQREGVVLTSDQVCDLVEMTESAEERIDEELRDELQARIAPVVREMPLKWRKALAKALATNVEDLIA